MSEPTVQYERSPGEWVPAVPLPLYERRFFRQRFVCHCGDRFKTEAVYKLHYKRSHIDARGNQQ